MKRLAYVVGLVGLWLPGPALYGQACSPAPCWSASTATVQGLLVAKDQFSVPTTSATDNVTTTISVSNTNGVLPGMVLTFYDSSKEQVYVKSLASGTSILVTRGFNGSPIVSHLAYTVLQNVIGSVYHNTLGAEIASMQSTANQPKGFVKLGADGLIPPALVPGGGGGGGGGGGNLTGTNLVSGNLIKSAGGNNVVDVGFPAPSTAIVGIADAQTITNKQIDATEISSGVLAGQRMPAFQGDVTSLAGSNTLTLSTVNSTPGTFGGSGFTLIATVDAKGRVSSLSSTPITGGGDVTASGGTLTANQLLAGNGGKDIKPVNLSGDITTNGLVATLASVNANPGTFGSATQIPIPTINAKGQITAMSQVAVATGTAPGKFTFTTAKTVSIPHNYNTTNLVWSCYDTSVTPNAVMEPGAIINVDSNNSTVTFLANVSGYCTPNGGVGPPGPQGIPGSGAGMTQLTGDVTTPVNSSGPTVASLSTVNSNVGTFGSSTQVPVVTVRADGRISSVTTSTITGGGGGGSGIAVGTTPPTNPCAAGDSYIATSQPAGQQLYICSSTNTWTQQVMLGPSGGLAYTSGALDIDPAVVPRKTAANVFTGLVSLAALRFTTQSTPASSSAACTIGDWSYDTGFMYLCTATNTWKRSALATW